VSRPPIEIALRAYYFVAFWALGLYLPFFPTWLRARGFTGWQMSALVTLLPLCQLASPAVVGILADRFSLRGRMMTFCAVSTAFGLSLLAIAALTLSPIPFFVAFGCILAFAALRSPAIGLADVLAMETSPNYGRVRLFGSLGFMTSAAVGGQLLDPSHEYQLPIALAAVVWTLTFISLLLPKNSHLPPRPALNDAKALLSQGGFRHLLGAMMIIFGAMSAYDLCISLRLEDLGAPGSYLGAFWSIATLSEVLMMYWAAPFLSRLGPGKLLTVSCLISAGRWAFLSQATSLTLILITQPLHAISFGLMWMSAIGCLKREVGEKGTATAQGLYGSSIAVGAALGLATWGIVYEKFGSETVFLAASGIATLGAVQGARLIRFTRPTTPVSA